MRNKHVLALATLVASAALVVIALESGRTDRGVDPERAGSAAEDGLAEAIAPLSDASDAEIAGDVGQQRRAASEATPDDAGRSQLDPIDVRLADAKERWNLVRERLNARTAPLYDRMFESGDFTVMAEGESPDAASGKLISVRYEPDGTVKVAEIPRAGHALEYTLKEEADSLLREMLLLEMESQRAGLGAPVR